MPRILVFFLVLLSSAPLAALEVFPPAPDSKTGIKLVVSTPYCQVERTDVAIQGSTINVTLTPPNGACLAIVFPHEVNLGLVPAGVYTVTAGFDTGRLVVRDADAGIRVSPVGGPAEGKRSVQIFGTKFGDTVQFDGIPTPVQQTATNYIVVTPPPHAPGTIDVTVTGPTGTRKVVAAYTYFDPEATPDPFVFEPLLFPVAYDGPGTFGSQWLTENRMGAADTLVRFRRPVPAKVCNGDCNGFNWSGVLAGQSQSGLLVWVVRRRIPPFVEDTFRASSRVIELSKQHGAGVSLPVAREDDFRRTFTIDAVPIGGDARTTLRLYSLFEGSHVSVDVTTAGGRTFHNRNLSAVNGIPFATIDLSSSSPRNELATVKVSGIDVWGLITVTDNTTQEVTALWPQ
jgi:IPT/TIG domain